MDEADFDAKPMILLVGQYSTGKTTFIKYLLEQEFPGMRIGPEPTTDCFIIITKVQLIWYQFCLRVKYLKGSEIEAAKVIHFI